MFVYDARKQPVKLVPLDTEVVTDRATRSLNVAVRGVNPERDPHNTSALVARAGRAFFEIGLAAPEELQSLLLKDHRRSLFASPKRG